MSTENPVPQPTPVNEPGINSQTAENYGLTEEQLYRIELAIEEAIGSSTVVSAWDEEILDPLRADYTQTLAIIHRAVSGRWRDIRTVTQPDNLGTTTTKIYNRSNSQTPIFSLRDFSFKPYLKDLPERKVVNGIKNTFLKALDLLAEGKTAYELERRRWRARKHRETNTIPPRKPGGPTNASSDNNSH